MITYSNAQTDCQNITSDTSSSALTFFQTFLNRGYKFILADLGRSIVEKTKTASTVANQQYYQTPPDFLWLKDMTLTVGSTIYPVVECPDQETWDLLNTNVQRGDVPSALFVRPFFGVGSTDIGIFPIPSSDGNTITMVYESSDHDLSVSDYTTGTVSVTNGSTAVVGVGTSFTAAMVGRWFSIADPSGDGLWYKVATRTDATHITISNYYTGATANTLGYTIAETFNLPVEMQILPEYFAIGHYYHTKGNTQKAIDFVGDMSPKDNSLFMSGLRAARVRYGTKSRSISTNRKNPWSINLGGGPPYPGYFPGSFS